MKKNSIPALLVFLLLTASVLIMVSPTFFSKDLSRIELKQDLQLDLVLSEKYDLELVFFGYAGCVDVCTPRLDDLAKWYTSIPNDTQEKVNVKFIDLSVPEDTELPATFAKAFHKDFTGVFLDESVLRIYSKAFGVYFSTSLMDENEIDHTTHLYLVKRDATGKKLRFIYTAYPFDFKQIQSDIEELSNEQTA